MYFPRKTMTQKLMARKGIVFTAPIPRLGLEKRIVIDEIPLKTRQLFDLLPKPTDVDSSKEISEFLYNCMPFMQSQNYKTHYNRPGKDRVYRNHQELFRQEQYLSELLEANNVDSTITALALSYFFGLEIYHSLRFDSEGAHKTRHTVCIFPSEDSVCLIDPINGHQQPKQYFQISPEYFSHKYFPVSLEKKDK